MKRRIFGIETEYGATCTLRGQRRLSPDEVSRYLFKNVVSWGRSSNVFLENGSRLYLDVGSHPEYATGECDSFHDVVKHDKAGELIMQDLQFGAEKRLQEEGIRGNVYIFKNNLDFAGNSYGCHENYLTSRKNDFLDYESCFIPYLITRQIFCGAGNILQTSRGPIFALSQRAEHIWDGVSSATTRSRPMINTRDEPHADAELHRRLHVIVGDSNMSEYATYLKIGSAALMLRMMEAEDFSLRDFTLENPSRAIRDISHDITCKKKFRLASGREISAIELQHDLVDRAIRFSEQRGLSNEELRVLAMWRHCIETIERDPMKLDQEVDWVIKYKILESYRSKHGIALDDARSHMIDLQYHDIKRDRGIFYKLQTQGLVKRECTDLEIESAKTLPPQTTRAKLRGDFIRQAKAKQRDFTVDWVHLKINEEPPRTVVCRDPLESIDPRVQKLIDTL